MKFLIVLLMLPTLAQARLFLNLSVSHHKGIDKGITLLSEFHSKEEVPPTKEVRVKMRDGIELQLKISFVDEPEVYGPSANLNIEGKIFTETGREMAKIENLSQVYVGSQLDFQITDNIGQLIEVSIKPEFK